MVNGEGNECQWSVDNGQWAMVNGTMRRGVATGGVSWYYIEALIERTHERWKPFWTKGKR